MSECVTLAPLFLFPRPYPGFSMLSKLPLGALLVSSAFGAQATPLPGGEEHSAPGQAVHEGAGLLLNSDAQQPESELATLVRGERTSVDEGHPQGWVAGRGSEHATLSWATVGAGDERALAVHNSQPADRSLHGWQQSVLLQGTEDWPIVERDGVATRRIELRARVSSYGMHIDAVACLQVQARDQNGRLLATAWTDRVEVDSAWQLVDAVLDLPGACSELRVIAYLTGKGSVWFDDIQLLPSERETRSSHTIPLLSGYERLARNCAQEIPWMLDEAQARERARREGLPILVYVRCVDADGALAAARESLAAPGVPFHDDGYSRDVLMRAGPLSDPDLAALIMRRFVPLLCTYDLSEHGLSPAADDPLRSFGAHAPDTVAPAFLVLDSSGRRVHKLHRLGALSASLLDGVLRGALQLAGAEYTRLASSAEEAYLDGELDLALELLGTRDGDDARILRARITLRRGEPQAALEQLSFLVGEDAAVQRGMTYMALGLWQQALFELEALSDVIDHPRLEQAAFWSAWCLERLGRHDEARQRFEYLLGPTRFGRKAAACLLPAGPQLALAETPFAVRLGAVLPEASEGFAFGDGVGSDGAQPEASLLFLLDQQREDGSFGSHAGSASRGRWQPGITAIVGEALRFWRPRVSGELRMRLEVALVEIYIWLDDWSLRPLDPGASAFNAPYVLRHALGCGQRELALRLVHQILAGQGLNEHWTVYSSGRPTSFLTALNLGALLDARRAGVAVPRQVLMRGGLALLSMRSPEGHFPYTTRAGFEWMTTAHGSIARDPLCASTLARLGLAETADVQAALERFLVYCGELRSPTKHLYDYFDLRGHGSYHYFFALDQAWNATDEAAEQLPKALRGALREALRTSLAAAREFDGTWVDHVMLGRAYGTAMALCILAGIDE